MITGFGHAFAHTSRQEDLWTDFFSEHYGRSAIARRLFASAGVQTRHAAVNPIVEDISRWSTGARMQRFLAEALPLARSAVSDALAEAGLDPAEIGLFAVVSCTGYLSPGIDTLVARDVGMGDSVQRLFIGHMGCYAALPGLSAVVDFVAARRRPAVLLCVELPSLHLQPPSRDVQQMVAHALFSDAASAVVVTPGPLIRRPGGGGTGLALVDVAVRTDVDHADLMTWTVTDLGFRLGLSRRVPDALESHVRPVVAGLLGRNHLVIDDVKGWAVHPGGPRILDVVGTQLDLKPDDLAASRAVLAEHGNCSSATTLVVLDRVRRTAGIGTGDHVVGVAFGPGLTLCTILLQSI